MHARWYVQGHFMHARWYVRVPDARPETRYCLTRHLGRTSLHSCAQQPSQTVSFSRATCSCGVPLPVHEACSGHSRPFSARAYRADVPPCLVGSSLIDNILLIHAVLIC